MDPQPYPGEKATMKELVTVSGLLRKMRLAGVAGVVPPDGPERRAFAKVPAKLAENSFWLQRRRPPMSASPSASAWARSEGA